MMVHMVTLSSRTGEGAEVLVKVKDVHQSIH